ncbi:thiopurine S-methyltransferase [Isorropodon fossajaponicum endosymbiont JTNG4]|uniref:thiopurine S-methyltransferase n=1 Tax=Isorropodon fossajaponicum symbiont TaxID=883811 RepID=UPI0019155F3D|nr:thiopurine S-methyltransferase [Isorropodon fossajaponicum symbiont]BBB24146.1 thiopurine S-methyltransferase [Isorropodon fossajaponicum endosymbiont JTNG4]
MTDWITRWQEGKIGWHKNQPNSRLIEFIDCLKLSTNACVFVPLCGKSVDMLYVLEKGFKVLGVELSELATRQFFVENELHFSTKKSGKFVIFSSENIDIYCGDYFDLDASVLNHVSAVYDRASLIALPLALRAKYASHLYAIIPAGCRMLLLTLNYPQSQVSGPPYAVNKTEVVSLFKGFECQQLQCFDDIKNEPKFQRENVDFIEKATYCLRKK